MFVTRDAVTGIRSHVTPLLFAECQLAIWLRYDAVVLFGVNKQRGSRGGSLLQRETADCSCLWGKNLNSLPVKLYRTSLWRHLKVDSHCHIFNPATRSLPLTMFFHRVELQAHSGLSGSDLKRGSVWYHLENKNKNKQTTYIISTIDLVHQTVWICSHKQTHTPCWFNFLAAPSPCFPIVTTVTTDIWLIFLAYIVLLLAESLAT